MTKRWPDSVPSEEQILLCAQAQAGDARARDKLVVTNMNAVTSRAFALRRISPEMDIEDLVHEGSFGLIRAIDTFDASKGVKFLTYAIPWIDNFIRIALFRNREIKPGDAWRGMSAVKLYSAAIASGASHTAALQGIEKQQGMRPETVQYHLSAMRRSLPASFETTFSADGVPHSERIACNASTADELLAAQQQNAAIHRVLNTLRQQMNTREVMILESRILQDAEDSATLKEIGDVFGLSRERIRQLETGILVRLRTMLQDAPELEGMDLQVTGETPRQLRAACGEVASRKRNTRRNVLCSSLAKQRNMQVSSTAGVVVSG